MKLKKEFIDKILQLSDTEILQIIETIKSHNPVFGGVKVASFLNNIRYSRGIVTHGSYIFGICKFFKLPVETVYDGFEEMKHLHE